MTCPGSVVLSEGMPNRQSTFADIGTKAHELAECWLKGVNPVDKWFVSADAREMRDYVHIYVNHVRDLLELPEAQLFVEQKVAISTTVWGTADALVWLAAAQHLHVIDLKYGAGVCVEVEGNTQLKIYALAALLTMGFPARNVTATIVQPRFPHRNGPIRSVTYSALELMDFHADIEEAVERVQEATNAYNA